MKDIIISVLTSWQIWVVTIALVIFISLVRNVSRGKSQRFSPSPAPKAKKVKADAKVKPAAAVSNTDDLGLEEGGDDVPIQEEE